MPYYALCVKSTDVKTVKNACESSNILSASSKIYKDPLNVSGRPFLVPTSIHCEQHVDPLGQQSTESDGSFPHEFELLLSKLRSEAVQFELRTVEPDAAWSNANQSLSVSPLQVALKHAIDKVACKYESYFATWHDLVPESFPKAYCIYPPMLLLPPTWYTEASCQEYLHTLKSSDALEVFFSEMCNMLGVSHVAVNAAIPSTTEDEEENVIRSPTQFSPIYGDFGPLLPPFPTYTPTIEDFNSAFWVSTRQNGICQIWAPRYTMFSAGNVTEKIRIVRLPSVQRAIDDGIKSGLGCSAVDLFAGIGYFAFSYAKAGVSKVICWDLNPWSVEGFRRGASSNRCGIKVVDAKYTAVEDPHLHLDLKDPTCRFIVFQESNIHAKQRILDMRSTIPPIRHVNCGMLPTVGEAWKTAVEAVDPVLGGWIHLHETVHDSKLQDRMQEIISRIREHSRGACTSSTPPQVELTHVEKVKSIGPRLSHVVLDIWLSPRAVAL